jgi:hypothetical protein
MRALIVILAAFTVGCGDARQTARLQTQLEEQQKQIRDLQAQVVGLSKSEALDLDEKCSKQALADFHEAGYKEGGLDSFTNHYNAELRKCFILIQSADTKTEKGKIWQNKDLWDAYERKNYAAFMWRSDPAKQVKPVECHVFMPTGEKKTCESAEEFDELVKTYMGRGGQ